MQYRSRIYLDEAIYLCYRDNFDISVTFKCCLGCTKDEFLKQFKLTFVEMNAMRREMKKPAACKTQVIN